MFKASTFKFGKGKGFTLVELLVVVAIIGIVSGILFLGRGREEKKLALERASFQIAQDLREVGEMARSAKKFDCGGFMTTDFGLAFRGNWTNQYVVFADCNSDKKYGSEDIDIRIVEIEEEVGISGLSPASRLDIIFAPPIPTIYIKKKEWGEEAEITLSSEDGSERQVTINSAGKIEIK